MSYVFAFPGQGSQFVGMGLDLYKTNKKAKQVFDEVNDALEYKLTDIIFNGDYETLTLTKHVQPAIMATSIAILKSQDLPNPSFVIGHSLGEYTALCAANSISLYDTTKLLQLRGESMQKACPIGTSGMGVILGLDINILKNICNDVENKTKLVCNIANDNDINQIVISGNLEAINMAMDIAKEKGAKRCIKLPLSVAPHSQLMIKIVPIMTEMLDKINIKKPICPLISNKTCNVMEDPNEIKKALIYQLTHGVRFRESVLNMKKLGITDSIEIGPGKTLSNLIKRIDNTINTNNIGV